MTVNTSSGTWYKLRGINVSSCEIDDTNSQYRRYIIGQECSYPILGQPLYIMTTGLGSNQIISTKVTRIDK